MFTMLYLQNICNGPKNSKTINAKMAYFLNSNMYASINILKSKNNNSIRTSFDRFIILFHSATERRWERRWQYRT